MSSAAAASERAVTVRGRVGREPISPELVLVDPELARPERLRLWAAESFGAEYGTRGRAALGAPVDISTLHRVTLSQAAEADRSDSKPHTSVIRVVDAARARLLPAVLLVSLFGNGLVISRLGTDHVTRVTEVVTVAKDAAPGSEAQSPKTTSAQNSALPAVRKGDAERAVLSLVLRSPRRKVPSQLIDSATGLLRNNVRAVCRRAVESASFLCVVARQGVPPAQGLYVRYWPKRAGRTAFKWFGFRDG
jgi:hypothetical protein